MKLQMSLAVPAVPMLLAIILTVQASAQRSTEKPQSPAPRTLVGTSPASGFQPRDPRYELRPGDVFDVSFEFTPEFNQTVSVQPDGYITLREAGDLHVGGMTVPELTDTIKVAYGKILKDPSVAVLLKDFDKPYFLAGGAVARPGKYDLRGDTTLVEAITIAGGFNDFSKHSQVVLFRRVSRDWMEGKVVDVKKMLHDKSLSEDLHLQPGDMVFVPNSGMSKIRHFIPVPTMGIPIP